MHSRIAGTFSCQSELAFSRVGLVFVLNLVLSRSGESVEVRKGSIDLFRYSTIENNLRRGEMELV